ncbi:MAG: right-handed parallel beta-helix repeat-containing protein [Casimicrobiaceae bacterium]
MPDAAMRLPCLFVAALLSIASATALAAAQRTFVASYGLAANTASNCSIAKPCRAFSEAIGVTNSGGEVIVLDSAGYGAVTIAQSVSIVAPAGVYAGISVSSGDGIVVDGASIRVVLRGLTINGLGGQTGIRFINGSELRIEKCIVANMSGNGMDLEAGGSNIFIVEAEARNNGQSGIYLQGAVTATIEDVRVEANAYGVYARSGGYATIRRSTATRNANGGFTIDSSTSNGTLLVSHSAATRNGFGVLALAAAGHAFSATIEDSTIEGNLNQGIGDNYSVGGGQLTVVNTAIVRNLVGINLGDSIAVEARRGNIVNNTFDQNSIAIQLVGSNTESVIAGNVITGGGYGIYLFNSPLTHSRNDNTLGNNTLPDVTNGPMTPLAPY